MSNRGRSTTGEAAVPYYRGTPLHEAAKYLRLVVDRFLKERATIDEVHEAIRMFEHEDVKQAIKSPELP